MDAEARTRLRTALRQRYPWVADTERGPAAVEAGECDHCGAEARLVMVCGPGAGQYLGRRCLQELGADAWCDGHADDAAGAMSWAAALEDEADVVARLWWVATGEVRLPPAAVAGLQATLGRGGPG